MSDTKTAFDELAERDERERREGLQRALDGGGMPTEEEFLAAEAKLQEAHSALEKLSFRLTGITDAAELDAPALPFAVTAEHVGLVAGFASTLKVDLIELRRVVDDLEESVLMLELIRREQGD
jgi:hypothetical protein